MRCKRHLLNVDSPESPWAQNRLERGFIIRLYKIEMTKWLERINSEEEKKRYMEHIDSEYGRYLKMRTEQLQELQLTGSCKFRMFQFKKFEFSPGELKVEGVKDEDSIQNSGNWTDYDEKSNNDN